MLSYRNHILLDKLKIAKKKNDCISGVLEVYILMYDHIHFCLHAKKTRLKITQLEKVRFMKKNELKLVILVFSLYVCCC